MPHKCTKCEEIFRSGDKRILSGCPKCGWNKFLFISEEAAKAELFEKNEEEISAEFDKIEKKLRQETIPEESDENDEDRVESVRILGPGMYELNIKTLLERKEIVMALKEEGKYVIHWPSVFGKRPE